MKPKKSASELLREERLKLQATAIEISGREEERLKKEASERKKSVEIYLNNSLTKMEGLLSGKITNPIVKRKFRETGKRGPKPKSQNKNLDRIYNKMEYNLAQKVRSYSATTGTPLRRIMEDSVKLYFQKLEN